MAWVTFNQDVEEDGAVVYRKGYQADVSGNQARAYLAKGVVVAGKHEFATPKKAKAEEAPVAEEAAGDEAIEIPTFSRKRSRSR